jgi:hypothetical protein
VLAWPGLGRRYRHEVPWGVEAQVLVWVGMSMVIGLERIRVRHAHASLVVGQEKACRVRRWTVQCGASEVRSWDRSAVAVC